MSGAAIVLVALVLDAALGWPDWLFQRIGHPVTWIGALVNWLDRTLNLDGTGDRERRIAGLVAALVVIGVSAEVAWLATWLLPDGVVGLALAGVLAWPFVAMRALHEHVAAVAQPLAGGDLTAARSAVARIVGRDPATLDEAGITRAAMESLAENTSDGIVAPIFWGVVFGLPGIAAYKAINTLDSMIGHRTPRHQAFGWASARIDDLANLVPARLTGLLYALVSTRRGAALTIMRQDARHHRSPNAGWPEAALAGALDVRLSGPRVYGNRTADEPWLNGAAPDPVPADLARALALFRRLMLTLFAGIAIMAALAALV